MQFQNKNNKEEIFLSLAKNMNDFLLRSSTDFMKLTYITEDNALLIVS